MAGNGAAAASLVLASALYRRERLGLVEFRQATCRQSSKKAAIKHGRLQLSCNAYVRALLGKGAATELDGRIALAASAALAPVVIDVMTVAHNSFVRLAEDLSADMTFATPTRAQSPLLRRMTLLAALDAWLIPFEYASEPVTDWTSRLVWNVIVVANVRHVTEDLALSVAYSHLPTPDEVRRPIPLRQIIRLTGLSYSTPIDTAKRWRR